MTSNRCRYSRTRDWWESYGARTSPVGSRSRGGPAPKGDPIEDSFGGRNRQNPAPRRPATNRSSDRSNSRGGKLARSPPEQKRLIDPCQLVVRQTEVPRARVLDHVLDAARLGDCKEWGASREESQNNLARRGTVRRRNRLENVRLGGTRRSDVPLPKRAVADERHAVLLAPREHRVLDGALVQMIEHLVASELSFA